MKEKTIIEMQGIIENKVLRIPIIELFVKDAILKAKKEVFDDIDRILGIKINTNMLQISKTNYQDMKKRHLSTLQKSKGT